jgi:transposase
MKKERAIFKPYHQNQLMMLPPTFEELIPLTHPVRVVDQIVNQINLDSVLNKYGGGGTSSYHPRMLLKVLIYGYLCNIYSSRKLEFAIGENIYFMWLSGMQQPDHNTLNRFRSERLKDVIKDIFSQVVLLMVDSGHVDLRSVYTDGTKIESAANRYTFVWGKAIKKSRLRIESQLEELWDYTQSIAREELLDTRPSSFEATDPKAVKDTIDRIDKVLKTKKNVDKKVRQKVNYARKHWPDAVERYNQSEEILQNRNSYSKTDPDATFMRMKEDYMKNGQLKPGYNVQISTHNQIITHYSIHQNPGDFRTLQPHLEAFEKAYGFMPEELTADAGYGSESNYEYLTQKEITPYVKYPLFNKEIQQKKSSPDNAISPPKNRFQELKEYVKSLLLSEKGIAHRKKRGIDVEPVFGNIKNNKGFKRFKLRGIENVSIEFGLLALAHNLAKLAKIQPFYNLFLPLYLWTHSKKYQIILAGRF